MINDYILIQSVSDCDPSGVGCTQPVWIPTLAGIIVIIIILFALVIYLLWSSKKKVVGENQDSIKVLEERRKSGGDQ